MEITRKPPIVFRFARHNRPPGCGRRTDSAGNRSWLSKKCTLDEGPCKADARGCEGSLDALPRRDFNHLGLKDDAATSTVEIVGGALEDVDVPADLAQQIAREEPAERPTNDQGPALVWAVYFRH